jgi:Fe-S-cluster-containing dehydrogenase component
MIEKMLVIDLDKCIGCRTCEMVCSLKHTGACSSIRSRIRVINLNVNGQESSIPMMCQHCEKPFCTEVCPTKACHWDLENHRVIIDQCKCIGCKICIMVCPFGAPSLDPIDRVIIKCDLCEGDPECVKLCPSETLKFIRVDKIGIIEKRNSLEKLFKAIHTLFY